MAIKKTVQTDFGFNVSDAYHRVEGVQIVGKDKISFQLRASVDGVFPHFSDKSYTCAFDINGENPISQAYDHLKTLPEFSDAVDC